MPTIINKDEIILRCACGDKMDHFATLIYEPWDDQGNNIKGEHDDWYLTVRLDKFHFWKRLKVAWKYLWGIETNFEYIEMALRNQDMADIAKWIEDKKFNER